MTRAKSIPNVPDPWRPARVVENDAIGTGSVWLTLEAADGEPAEYAPGHVLSVGIRDPEGKGTIHRHAYTVSEGRPEESRFSHLYRVIREGRLTPRLARLVRGDELWFHGPFHTPIEDEIDPTASGILGVATGTGVGPLFGFARKALTSGERRPIALYASFRRKEDLVLVGEMNRLSAEYPNFIFEYALTEPPPDWTGPVGRVQQFVPPRLEGLGRTHLHLVGRGDMVHHWRRAWLAAGLKDRRVSIETYFNHHEKPATSAVETLAEALRSQS